MGSILVQDFIQDGKTFMIIDREQGFQAAELSRTQTGMMLSSRIQGVLQLHLHDLNMMSQLRYDITGKRMLKHCLQSEAIGIAEYLGLLLQLVTTLEEANQHMLSLPNYVLNEDYMFIEGTLQAGRLYITYVPVLESLTDTSVQEQISQLASQWIITVRELYGNVVQQILRHCQQEQFTLASLKQLLLSELAGEQRFSDGQDRLAEKPYLSHTDDHNWTYEPIERSMHMHANTDVPSNMKTELYSFSGNPPPASHRFDSSTDRVTKPTDNAVTGQPIQAGLTMSPHTDAFKPTGRIAGQSSTDQAASASRKASTAASLFFANKKKQVAPSSHPHDKPTDQMETKANKLPSSYRTYLLAGSLLLIAMIWRYGYMEHGNELMLYGCSALTLAVILILYLLIKGKLSIKPQLKPQAESTNASFAAPLKPLQFGSKASQQNERSVQEQWRWNKEVTVGTSATTAKGMPATTQSGREYSAAPIANTNAHPRSSQEQASQRERSVAELFGSFTRSTSGNMPEMHESHVAYDDPEMMDDRLPDRKAASYTSMQHGTAAVAANVHRSEQSTMYSEPWRGVGYAEPGDVMFGDAFTETLSSHMATVLLDAHQAPPQTATNGEQFRGYLERHDQEGDGRESIRLRNGSFIIGRAEDGVHYREQSLGTSRNHVELEVRSGNVFIKDLGSRNGTQLKDESLVPYKTYPIQDGESFTIARTVYTLRLNG
ncbi:DUF6382 domain-containing protein [Paenibacillus sp. SGZ-1009]|uniref:DUF6382 domain-containing protein n=1 Tax=Paenibacillus campi TaxID=3106031 RepID=UPI002AFFDA4B|nr:DUF6382 domain-containing protein [Paenibacillus sp. SGZ-1009]